MHSDMGLSLLIAGIIASIAILLMFAAQRARRMENKWDDSHITLNATGAALTREVVAMLVRRAVNATTVIMSREMFRRCQVAGALEYPEWGDVRCGIHNHAENDTIYFCDGDTTLLKVTNLSYPTTEPVS